MTPLCQRRADESITAWHRRIHETAHDWRDVAEFLTLRGLHAEAKMITSVAHLKREERTVALLGVAEERDREAVRLIESTEPTHEPCGMRCVWEPVGNGICSCDAPHELKRLRQRARALRWATEALMRPEQEAPPSTERSAIQADGRRLADQMTERAGGLARSAAEVRR